MGFTRRSIRPPRRRDRRSSNWLLAHTTGRWFLELGQRSSVRPAFDSHPGRRLPARVLAAAPGTVVSIDVDGSGNFLSAVVLDNVHNATFASLMQDGMILV